MEPKKNLTTDNKLFSSFLDNEILVIREKQHILHLTEDVSDILSLYDYMNSVLSSRAYKALVMFARSEKNLHVEYRSFLSKILSENWEKLDLNRFLNEVNKVILTLATIPRITVFAGQGTISLFYLNIGLAFDYRIVAENTVFENPNLDIALVTKGSGYFLPRLLGIRKATEVLLRKSFSAEDALQLGLVDLIVPVARLEEETMQFVSGNQGHLSSTLLDIRKLFKCDIKELQRSLELEDSLIKERLRSEEFLRTFSVNHENSGG
jgi:2-(1,2-epoxy-1,2-dihydrophenyl)acetyl-CoA isomerase